LGRIAPCKGTAYVFVKTGSSWTQKAKLTASDGKPNDDLGLSVGVSSDGSTIVAGAVGSNSFQGAAYVFVKCSPAKPDVDGDGHEKGDDGREGQFQFCKSSDEMDFEERDSNGRIFGQPLRAKMNAVTVSGNQAIITGSGTLADGTPVNYTAVVLGNQPVIGANTFAISWVTATGSVFQTSGPLTDGYIVVH
jgi:hypothetical protein